MSHTPGPWVVRSIDGSLGTIETADGTLQVAQAQELSATDRNAGSLERVDNARLIAAAPDLLEALKWLLGLPGAQETDPHAARFAAAAIAKATGEQA